MTEAINHPYMPKLADELKTLKAIKPYLCFYTKERNPQNRTIEKICAFCQNRCAYGQRWLDLFWAEEDLKWELERAKQEEELEAKRREGLLETIREMSGQAERLNRQAIGIRRIRGARKGGGI